MPKKHTPKQVKGELHPRSRKSAQLKRTLLREQTLGRNKLLRAHAKASPIVDRLMWFKLILDDDQKSLTEEELHELILLYISRFAEDMDTLRATLRPGRPLPKRLDELEMCLKHEQQEYESTGFNVADLRDPRCVEALRRWNGDYNGVKEIKQVRLVAMKE